MKRKLVISIIILINIICFTSMVEAKYVIEYQKTFAKIHIDIIPPKVELVGVQKVITESKKDENKKYHIIAQIKAIESNIIKNNISSENIIFTLDGKEIKPENVEIIQRDKQNNVILYDIICTGIETHGKFDIIIKEGTIVDKAYNINSKLNISV